MKSMDAAPLLHRIAGLLQQHKLEVILIGNAAAALHGAPVTTVDIDFLFRKSPANLKKLRALAAGLGAVILRPYYPVSGLYRLSRDEDGLQLDFMTVMDGVRSFEGLRGRATALRLGSASLLVAGLADIMKRRVSRKTKLAALKKESELALEDQIRRALARPMEQRTHFLRKRIGLRMTCI